MTFIIVSPYSPKWNNIASVRWEKLSKYLSQSNEVFFITSKFPDGQTYRSFDMGNSTMIEIPLRYSRYNPHSKGGNDWSPGWNLLSRLLRKFKAEARPVLERFLPISSGGMLLHDYEAYVSQIENVASGFERFVLVTTYDPWFTIKLGRFFKKQFGNRVIWIADFRDPSFDIHESIVTKLPIFRLQTQRVLTAADAVLVVTKKMVEAYQKICGNKVFLLPNGHDGKLPLEETTQNLSHESLKIVYTGSLHPKTVELTWFTLSLLRLKEREREVYSKIKFVYAGKDYNYVQTLFQRFSLLDILENQGFVSRDETLKLQSEADILLLIAYTGDDPEEGSSIRTGKVYEYLASGKPILVIAPKNWEMREEIESDGVSKVFEKSEAERMAEYIVRFYREKRQVDQKKREEVLDQYSYESLSKKLEEIVKALVRR